MKVNQGTVCFMIKDLQVLLALIEYAAGDQKWNGIGGIVEAGETPKQAAVREIGEETHLLVAEQDLEPHGFEMVKDLQLYIFTFRQWSGQLTAKDPTILELKWFNFAAVPYDQMWPGNDNWLRPILSTHSVKDGKTGNKY